MPRRSNGCDFPMCGKTFVKKCDGCGKSWCDTHKEHNCEVERGLLDQVREGYGSVDELNMGDMDGLQA